jgi:hypothetical protein
MVSGEKSLEPFAGTLAGDLGDDPGGGSDWNTSGDGAEHSAEDCRDGCAWNGGDESAEPSAEPFGDNFDNFSGSLANQPKSPRLLPLLLNT